MDATPRVGNLPFETTEDAIRRMLAQRAMVVSLMLVRDRPTAFRGCDSHGRGYRY